MSLFKLLLTISLIDIGLLFLVIFNVVGYNEFFFLSLSLFLPIGLLTMSVFFAIKNKSLIYLIVFFMNAIILILFYIKLQEAIATK